MPGEGYSRGERAAGAAGAVLFAALALIAIDLATGGRVFRRARAGCGCPEDTEAAADV